MIVDTSALVAIAMSEPEAERFVISIESIERPRISAVNALELTMVLESASRGRATGSGEQIIRDLRIAVIPADLPQLEAARDAFRRFGKGRHPAALNFGDCFSYALAKHTGEPLLFKGTDFDRTDILVAAY